MHYSAIDNELSGTPILALEFSFGVHLANTLF